MHICEVICVHSHGCPIKYIQFELFIIGSPHDSHFSKLIKITTDVLTQKSLILKFDVDMIR